MKTRRTPWRARLQIVWWRHGGAGTALLVALLVLAGLLTWMLQQADAALAQTQQALANGQSRTPVDTPPAEDHDENTRLAALQAVLVASPPPDEVVRHMAELAQRAGIAWAQGEYRAQWHADTQTTQWQVTQPALASYPQLRQLIDAVLRAHPNVSLDHMAVQRDDAAQSQAKVRLRWSIWTRGAAAPR